MIMGINETQIFNENGIMLHGPCSIVLTEEKNYEAGVSYDIGTLFFSCLVCCRDRGVSYH